MACRFHGDDFEVHGVCYGCLGHIEPTLPQPEPWWRITYGHIALVALVGLVVGILVSLAR